MKKRFASIIFSCVLVMMLTVFAGAQEVVNWPFSDETAPVSIGWTDGDGEIVIDDGKLKIDAGASKGIETTDFSPKALNDFSISYQYYPTGDWFTDSLYFHYIDNDNYYILKVIGNQSDDDWAKESRRTVTLLKKANGTEEKLAGTQLGAMPASGNDAYSVKVTYENGEIQVYFAAGASLPETATLSYEDKTPLSAGNIRFFKYDNVSRLDNVVIHEIVTASSESTDPTDPSKPSEPIQAGEIEDPKNPVISWDFAKSSDPLPVTNVSTAGGRIQWESGRLKIVGRTVGDQLVETATSPLVDRNTIGDFTWQFDYEPEHIDWNVDRFIFHAADRDNTLELRVLGNSAKDLSDVNTTGGGSHHNIKLINRINGVNTVLASYDLPDGLDLRNYTVRVIMKGSNIKVWFAPKNQKLGNAAMDYTFSTLPEEFSAGQFMISTYAGNFLIDNVVLYNTASPDYLKTNGSVNTGVVSNSIFTVALLTISTCLLLSLLAFRIKKRHFDYSA